MTGEMAQSEVTRENYPELYALRDALKRRGIKSQPRAFDQYQGPYLAIPGIGKVWYSQDYGQGYAIRDASGQWRDIPAMLTIERGASFLIDGGDHEHARTEREYAVACFTVRQASKRIARLAAEVS
jgi:hypothetical protein